MSQGTLLANFRARCAVPEALVRYLGLDVAIVAPEDNEALWARHFPLKLVPCFIGPSPPPDESVPEDFTLSEVIAIMYYLVGLSPDTAVHDQLLGATLPERAKVLQYLSLANSDMLQAATPIVRTVRGVRPYARQEYEASLQKLETIAAIHEQRLEGRRYLATERDEPSLADLFTASAYKCCFENFYGEAWRSAHPRLMEWFERVAAGPAMAPAFAQYKPLEVAPAFT